VAELLGRDPAHGDEVRRELDLAAPDHAVLLADWIAELAYLAESEGFVPSAVERIDVAGDSVSATVAGRRGDPPHLVKAVTYHRLEFERGGAGWRGRVVLDV
jgi:SHS2 domain-containing protein